MMPALALLEGSAIFAALSLMTFGWHRPLTGDWVGDGRALVPLLVLSLGTIAALYYADAYDLHAVPGPGRLAARLPRCLAFALVPLGAVYLIAADVGAHAALGLGVILGLLPLLRAPFYQLVKNGVFAESVLIIGTGPLARRAIEAVEREGRGGYAIVGVVDDEMDSEEAFVPHEERLGPLACLDRIIATTFPDRIVVALEERRRRLPVRPLLDARLSGIMIEDGAAFYERLTGKIAIEALTPSSLIFSQDYRTPLVALVLGRALSLTVALVGLVLLAPLVALIALAIRLDSPGPAFFVQERVGRGDGGSCSSSSAPCTSPRRRTRSGPRTTPTGSRDSAARFAASGSTSCRSS